MKEMNLFGSKNKSQRGSEIPGMISIYLVRSADGRYYAGLTSEGPIYNSDWSKAAFFFTMKGMLEAKEIATRVGGEVCIVNCTPVEPYSGL